MHCPYCRHTDSRVVDSRTTEDGSAIRRRRQCPQCGRRFSTVETTSLSVVKRSGVVEPFSRDKVVTGVRKACQGRPVSDDALALLAQRVEETVRGTGSAEIDAHDVGLAILGPLRELDEIAYLRFASVYQKLHDARGLRDRHQRAARRARRSGRLGLCARSTRRGRDIDHCRAAGVELDAGSWRHSGRGAELGPGGARPGQLGALDDPGADRRREGLQLGEQVG